MGTLALVCLREDARFDRVASRMERVISQLGDAADSVDLIHADLHLDNALFWHDDIRIIDFDDCGFGYWPYDIAVALWELRHRHDYEQFHDAFIEGYTQHRPLPADLAYLDDFIATATSPSGCRSPPRRRPPPAAAMRSARHDLAIPCRLPGGAPLPVLAERCQSRT